MSKDRVATRIPGLIWLLKNIFFCALNLFTVMEMSSVLLNVSFQRLVDLEMDNNQAHSSAFYHDLKIHNFTRK